MNRPNVCWVMLLVSLGVCLGETRSADGVEVSATARLLPSGDAVEVEYQSEGYSWKDRLPVHRSGDIRYFSAGVGIAERQADYPPFPLKIILTAGGPAYVAHVDVHIVQANGTATVSVPGEHVTGPWLFVDLPPGEYEITGNRQGDKSRLGSVKVTEGTEQVVYLRFAN